MFVSWFSFCLTTVDSIHNFWLQRSDKIRCVSDVDVSRLLLLLPPSGSESKPWTAWEQAPLVTPSSWRQSPFPRSHPAWSAPPSAIRPSGWSGATVQPKPPPQMPSSISCRWRTRTAGQLPISHARGSGLTRDEPITEKSLAFWGEASDNCIEEGGVHRKQRRCRVAL